MILKSTSSLLNIFIYWMEYAHRMWGRGLGIVFALPLSFFLAKGYIIWLLGLRQSVLFALGRVEGLVGWWMVKSGLEEPASEYVQPRVCPYRFATHLTSAFIIYGGILWAALSVVMPEPLTEALEWCEGMMGDTWIPDDIFNMEPLFRNFFENTSTVQLSHRILATTTLLSVAGLWWAAYKIELHPAIKSLIAHTLRMASLQLTVSENHLLVFLNRYLLYRISRSDQISSV